MRSHALRRIVGFEPRGNLLAAPQVIVVQVYDQARERELLLAALRTRADDVFEAVEQALEPWMQRTDRFRKMMDAFVRGAERARAAIPREVAAEGLRPPLRTFENRVGELAF